MKTKYLVLLIPFCTVGFACKIQNQTHLLPSKRTILKVCDVKPAKDTLKESPCKEIWANNLSVTNHTTKQEALYNFIKKNALTEVPSEALLDSIDKAQPQETIEIYSSQYKNLVPISHNGFFSAAHQAYADHRPLIISPDMIWLLISQGFAMHINENAEKLRHHFVPFEGKKELNIGVGHYPLAETEWKDAFSTFKQQIAGYTGKELTDLVAARFSETTVDAQVAFDITLMDGMKNYFDYSITVICGIPEIIIEGTVEDWQQIEERTAKLAQYDLDWWVKDLKPILTAFTNAVKGQKDTKFWTTILKIHYESKGCTADDYLTGWLGKLYPYIQSEGQYVRNPLIGIQDFEPLFAIIEKNGRKWEKYSGPKVEPKDLPSGMSSAEILLDDNGNCQTLKVKAGFIGIQQENLALRPVISWAVTNKNQKPDAARLKRYQEAMQKRATQKPLTQEVPTLQKN